MKAIDAIRSIRERLDSLPAAGWADVAWDINHICDLVLDGVDEEVDLEDLKGLEGMAD